MVDEPDRNKDTRIGNHILNVHQSLASVWEEEEEEEMESTEANAAPYTKSQMQLYIKYIRTIQPKLTPQVLDVTSCVS